jgi:hypothetical protein
MEKHLKKKAEIEQNIDDLKRTRLEIIDKKKTVNKKITFFELEEYQKFDPSINERQFFLDTIKIIAY